MLLLIPDTHLLLIPDTDLLLIPDTHLILDTHLVLTSYSPKVGSTSHRGESLLLRGKNSSYFIYFSSVIYFGNFICLYVKGGIKILEMLWWGMAKNMLGTTGLEPWPLPVTSLFLSTVSVR